MKMYHTKDQLAQSFHKCPETSSRCWKKRRRRKQRKSYSKHIKYLLWMTDAYPCMGHTNRVKPTQDNTHKFRMKT